MNHSQYNLNFSSASNQQERLDYERHLQIINDFGMLLLQQTTMDEIVWLIAKSVIAKMDLVDCVIYLFDETGTKLIQKAAHGEKNPIKQEILNPIIIPVGKGIVGTVAKTGIAEIIHDTRNDERYIVDDSNRLSEITVPIVYEGKVLGIIDSEHPKTNAFNQKDLRILTTIASMSAIKMVHAKTLQDLQDHKDNLEKEVKRQTQQLTETIASLERSNQDLESFAYAASHDMQEPLRTIVNYLQLIEHTETSLSESSHDFLSLAVDGTKRLKLLLDGLLKYSLVKNSTDSNQAVNLGDLMQVVKANLQLAITENKTIFSYQNLPIVLGNEIQLQQLFQNLIANAIKFQPPNQQAHIIIQTVEKESFYEFSIKDNGLGIAPQYHQNIFGLFKRLHSKQSYKGSGIGLSLCRRIVEYHNGEIRLESEVGEGTTFIFTLPKE